LSYLAIKHLHLSCVILSGLGFLVRGRWMLQQSPVLQGRWVRILPHIVDSTLLGSAITLAYLSGQYPLANGWLTAKLLGLLAYIVLGAVALKRGKSVFVRRNCFVLAIVCYAYIVSVALTRQVLPFL
jgi:uncharacterized membrane protein SirB2